MMKCPLLSQSVIAHSLPPGPLPISVGRFQNWSLAEDILREGSATHKLCLLSPMGPASEYCPGSG